MNANNIKLKPLINGKGAKGEREREFERAAATAAETRFPSN